MPAGDVSYIEIIPSFDKFFRAVKRESGKAGEVAGATVAEQFEKSIERQQGRVDNAAKKLTAVQDRVKKKNGELAVAEQRLTEILEKGDAPRSKILAAEQKIENIRADIERVTKDQAKAERALARETAKLETAQKNMADAVGMSGAKFRESEGFIAKYKKTLGGVAGVAGAALGAAGVAGFFGDAIAKGREFDQVMGSIGAVSGASADELAAVKARSRELGKDTELAGTSAASAANAMLELSKGGMSVAESMDAAKGSIMLAGAAQIDAGEAAAIQIAALNSFGLTADQATRVADVLTNTANASATGVTDLAEALKMAAPTASTLGVSLEDTNTMIGMFANNGIQGTMAGTAMRAALLSLTSPSKEAAKALDDMGIKAFDANNNFVGMSALSEQLSQAQERMGDTAFTAAASVAFGRQAVGFATTAAKGGAAAFDELREKMDRQGSAGETAGAKLAGLNGAMDRITNVIDDVKQRFYEMIAPSLTAGIDLLAKGIGWVGDNFHVVSGAASAAGGVLRTTYEWVLQHKDALMSLAVSVGAAWGAYKMLSTWQNITKAGGIIKWLGQVITSTKLYSGVTKIATSVAKAFRFVTSLPLGGPWLIAISAIVAGLTYFFTKTETGKKLVKNFVDFIVESGEAIKQGFSDLWNWLGDVWGNLGGWFSDNVAQPFRDGWNGLIQWWGDSLRAVGDWWDGLSQKLKVVGAWIAEQVFDYIQWRIDVFKAGFEIAVNAITGVWDWLKDSFKAVGDFIVNDIFGGLSGGLDRLQGAFDMGVQGIGVLWEGLKAIAAKPVKFVVDTVFNNGIVAAWNKVAGWAGLSQVEPYTPAWLGGYASGGVLPGYTPGRDPYTFIEPNTGMTIGLSGGEAIVRPEATRVLGSDWVDGINAAARVGGTAGVQKFLGGFAGGGVIGSISNLVRKYFPGMTITSTYRPGDPGWHGQGKAVDFSDGYDDTPGMQRATKFLFDNYGAGLLELIHSPTPWNVKNGNSVGDGFGFYGAATMNAHRNHVHVASAAPLGSPEGMVAQVGDFIGGVVTSLRQRVATAIAGILDPIGAAIPAFPGVVGGLPRAAFDNMRDAITEFIGGKTSDVPAGGVAGSAESWREMAMQAMRRQGFNADDPVQVNAMLAQIMSESGGIPGRVQEIVDINGTGESAGVGLLQIIPGTFAAHRDPELPNDRKDPWANMNAALRYYKARYGSDLTTMWGHGHGYALGGILPELRLYDNGGWLNHGATALNLSGKPEPVFTAEQWSVMAGHLRNSARLADGLGELVPALRGFTDEFSRWANGVAGGSAPNGAGPLDRAVSWLSSANGKELADTFGKLPGLGTITSTFGGIIGGHQGIVESFAAEQDALAKVASAQEEYQKKLAELSEAEKAGSELTAAQKRKLADAEAAVAKAREGGDVEKIADAEKKLQRVREDNAAALEKDTEKRSEKITKAQEAVKAAELGLADARAGVVAAARATGNQQIALAIEVANVVYGVVDKFISSVLQARVMVNRAIADATATARELANTAWETYQTVEKTVIQVSASMVELESLWRSVRVAQADVTRAHLAGVVDVAKAEQKLAAERAAVAARGVDAFSGVFGTLDRYWAAEQQLATGRLGAALQVTPEILALEHEVRVAQLSAAVAEREKGIAALEAAFNHQQALADLQLLSIDLAEQTFKLHSLNNAGFKGTSAEGARWQEELYKNFTSLAEVRAERDSLGTKAKGFFGRLFDWNGDGKIFGRWENTWTGKQSTLDKQIENIQSRINELVASAPGSQHWTKQQLDQVPAIVDRVAAYLRAGDEATAKAVIENSFLGDVTRAKEKLSYEQDMQAFKSQRERLMQQQQAAQNKLNFEKDKQALNAQIESLRTAASSHENYAAALREENPAVAAAYRALAEFNAAQARDVAANTQVRNVTINLPAGEQVFTKAQVKDMLNSLDIEGLNVRVADLETAVSPTPAGLLESLRQ